MRMALKRYHLIGREIDYLMWFKILSDELISNLVYKIDVQ